MRHVRRPAVTLAATCLALSALSACGGGEGDGEEPTSTTVSPLPGDSTTSSSSSSSGSTSTSSSSSSKGGDAAPELPAAAKEHTKDGAVAFATFYWEESGRALKTGDTKALQDLSTDCVPCDEYIRLVDSDAKKGLHADVDPTTIESTKVTASTDGRSDQAVTLSVDDSAYKLVDSKGKSHGHSKAVKYDVIVYVNWQSSGWTVVDDFLLT